jgi:hypothetical protein
MRGFRAFPPLLLGVGVGVPGVGIFFDPESIQPGNKDPQHPRRQPPRCSDGVERGFVEATLNDK